MPEHVNMMDKSMKLIKLSLTTLVRKIKSFSRLLKSHNEEMWNNSSEELFKAFE